ncbi:helix-turn-helix domain-containing protein [Dasania marina]|uniref:helix-turn-helix domain-containing protein n=1 Tax=Dasania marina TaxID=471499 RepID=UPI0030D9A7F3|tara:strand:- start:49261 stop:50079 length:819 start_codon:yes stop_codon:yes gene_type:complete
MHSLSHLGFQRYAPQPALAPYVQCYWQISQRQTSQTPEFMHPEGGSGIIFNFADAISLNNISLGQGSLVTGPSRRSAQLWLGNEVDTFGVRFHPGKGRAILALPLMELLDSMVNPAELALPTLGDELADQLAALTTASARVAHLENVLLAQLGPLPALDPRLDYALQWISANHGLAPISQLSSQLSTQPSAQTLSQRQLDRLFQQQLGLSPKQYSRLRQADYARQLLKQAPTQHSLTDISYQAGFYDQAHFIRQFRQVVGITPGSYRAIKAS